MRPPDYLPGDPYIIKKLRGRMDQGFSNIVLVEGPTRWGKSLACIEMAAALDPQFSMEGNVFHTVKQLLLAIKKKPDRDYISYILEEGEKAASGEEWYKKVNKVIGWFAKTSAFKNFTLFINLTTESSFTKKVREEVTMILEGHVSLRRGEFFVKLPFRKHNKKLGVDEIYKMFPRIKDKNGYWSTFKSYQFPKEERLPESLALLWRSYLKLKSVDFDDSLNQWIEMIENEEREERVKVQNVRIKEIENEKKENRLLYGTKRNQSPNQLANLKHSGEKYRKSTPNKSNST